MPWSLSLTITTRSSYAVTVGWGLGSAHVLWAWRRWERKAFSLCCYLCPKHSCSSTPLRLAAFRGVVLSPTELSITVKSLWIFCVHLAASWICWRISLVAGWRSTSRNGGHNVWLYFIPWYLVLPTSVYGLQLLACFSEIRGMFIYVFTSIVALRPSSAITTN